MFALISFLCVWLDGSPAPYLVPGRDLFEAIPMSAFFLLMTAYLSQDKRNQQLLPGSRGMDQGSNGYKASLFSPLRQRT